MVCFRPLLATVGAKEDVRERVQDVTHTGRE